MTGRLLLLLLVCMPVAVGCRGLHRHIEPDGAKDRKSVVVDAVESERRADGWSAWARRRLAQVARDVRADLDFHESEGLEAFAPDARQQVEAMRGDMNGPAGLTR